MGAAETSITGWRFPPQFFKNGKEVFMVSDRDDIKESLEILLSTAIGERLYRSGFGCDLKKFMFEETNSALVSEIRQMIADAIYDYEPRVELQEIIITESEESAHVLLININYLIKATDDEQNMVYSFSLY